MLFSFASLACFGSFGMLKGGRRTEGRKEGRADGRTEGMKSGRKENRKGGREAGRADGGCPPSRPPGTSRPFGLPIDWAFVPWGPIPLCLGVSLLCALWSNG